MIGDNFKPRPGFTLMETLVALTLFVLTLTLAGDLFLAFTRTTRKTENLQEVHSQARFILEKAARALRELTLDYARYREENRALNLAQDILYFRDARGEALTFRAGQGEECGSAPAPCLLLIQSAQSESLTGNGVVVRRFQAIIFPELNPRQFDRAQGRFLADAQPRVTLLLVLQRGRAEANDFLNYAVQTTLSNRLYER